MARSWLIILELFLQAVSVQPSELGFDSLLQKGNKEQHLMESVPLNHVDPHNSSASNFCHHNLLSLHHQLEHAHIDDNEEICPKAPMHLVDWPAGMTAPWTEIPACSILPQAANNTTKDSDGFDKREAFCVFTSTSFLGGRGISIVTKPEIASQIAKSQSFKESSHPKLHRAGPPPYEIKQVQGKGMGVIANRTILRGEPLFVHSTIGIFHNDAFVAKSNREYGLLTGLIEEGVERLPEEMRGKFHAMIGQKGSRNEVVGKLNVNTFAEEFFGEEHSIIIPETARLNHDCRPNAMYYFDPKTLVHYTHASTTIYAGEEITITYIDPVQSREIRQAAIQDSWGFNCTCTLCTQPPSYTEASDDRIAAINDLIEVMNGTKNRTKNHPPTTKEEGPLMAELLIELYEMERLYSHIVDAWAWAAVTLRNAGRKWEALRWAYKSQEGFIIHEEPDNAEAVHIGKSVWDMRVELGLEEEDEDDD